MPEPHAEYANADEPKEAVIMYPSGRASVSVLAVGDVSEGDLLCTPDGLVLGRARNAATEGQQVGVAVTDESGWNVYSQPEGPHPVKPFRVLREKLRARGGDHA
jgi:hypothetical protein